MQLALAHVHAHDLRRAVLQRAVGEAAVLWPTSGSAGRDLDAVAASAPSVSPPRGGTWPPPRRQLQLGAPAGMSSPFLATLFQERAAGQAPLHASDDQALGL